MIDLEREKALSLEDVSHLLPPNANGARVNVSTLTRWILKGINTSRGRVKLDAARVGRRWVTSHEALARFVEQLTPQLDQAEAPAPRSPAKRERAAERAERQLQEIGM